MRRPHDADQDNPALHNPRYALLRGSTEKARKCQAMAEANAFKKRFATVICYHFIPGEAAKLLDANKFAGPAGPQTREAEELLARTYFYLARAQFFHVYVDLV
jgi:hypothetical protein